MSICVEKLTDPHSIAAAFQQAVDMVVTDEIVNRILTSANPQVTHEHRFVRWAADRRAMGGFSMLATGMQTSITLQMRVGYSRREDHVEYNPPVSEDNIRRLVFRLVAPDFALTVPLVYDQVDCCYYMTVTIPVALFRARQFVRVEAR